MRLKDNVAIVAGGAHGMGEAEARLFAAEGARVIVADIRENEPQIVATDIRDGASDRRRLYRAITAPWDRSVDDLRGYPVVISF
jgi:NAD(P)-dependent dehydrogenase (short-subunit alcohol dehydrogenase family)